MEPRHLDEALGYRPKAVGTMIGVGSRPAAPGARPTLGVARASEREFWIALSLIPGIGPAAFTQLLRRHGTAGAAWRAGREALSGLGRVSDEAVAAMASLEARDPRALARSVEEATRAAGGRIVTWLDEAYPVALLTLDPRAAHAVRRRRRRGLRERGVAIVGTRRASGYGLAVATEIADELARAGVVVVSGLALGIDGAAHRAAVAAGGRSIAVLPSPLDRIYPPRHRPLAREIVAAGGALVTEVPTGATVGRPDFARRNRIIAGLAEAVVVTEAPDRSGALLTAAAAIGDRSRAVRRAGPIGAMGSRGCNRLIADHQATDRHLDRRRSCARSASRAVATRPPSPACPRSRDRSWNVSFSTADRSRSWWIGPPIRRPRWRPRSPFSRRAASSIPSAERRFTRPRPREA